MYGASFVRIIHNVNYLVKTERKLTLEWRGSVGSSFSLLPPIKSARASSEICQKCLARRSRRNFEKRRRSFWILRISTRAFTSGDLMRRIREGSPTSTLPAHNLGWHRYVIPRLKPRKNLRSLRKSDFVCFIYVHGNRRKLR